MDSFQIAALVAAAVIAFWMLGAYNRLIGLRNDINAAFTQFDEALAQHCQAARSLVAALREPMPYEQGALDALQNATTQLQQASDAMKLRPAAADNASALAGVASDFSAVGSRVRALSEQHSGWRPELAAEVAQQLTAWRDAQARMAFTRQLFNQAVTSYNEAASQFPTRLVARVCGFAPAGLI